MLLEFFVSIMTTQASLRKLRFKKVSEVYYGAVFENFWELFGNLFICLSGFFFIIPSGATKYKEGSG